MRGSSTAGALARAGPARHASKETKDRAREIAAGALALFAERDFASVTIKDIAQATGINTALIYYYFKSKEDLFRFAIESAIKQALENYQRIGRQRPRPEDVINDWFDNNIELAETIADLLKIMLDYARSRRAIPSVDALIRRFYDEECRLLARAIDDGVAHKTFRPVDSARLALFVSSHLDGIIVAGIVRPGFDLRQAFDDLRSFLWRHLAPDR
jgi:AcrR family transcriptional regulator